MSEGLTWYIDDRPKPPDTLFVVYVPKGTIILSRTPDAAMCLAGFKLVNAASVCVWMVPGRGIAVVGVGCSGKAFGTRGRAT